MNKYRIIRYERFNKKGELIVSKFYIQERKVFFRIPFWKYVTTNTGYTISNRKYPEKVKFTFLEEAQDFIEDVLIKKKPFGVEKNTVVQTY